MPEALIALGGNVGDVRDTFRNALAMLCTGAEVSLIARSRSYLTPPWGVEGSAAVHQLLRGHRNHVEPA